MTPTPLPYSRDLVFVGGGHAHALVLRAWGMAPLPGARVTVIDPGATAPYTGMLPGLVAGHYTQDQLEIDLVKLCRFAGARLVMARATGIDAEARMIHVEGRPPIAYDVASIDVGIHSDMPDLPGFASFGTAAKPLGPFAAGWARFLDQAGARRVPPQATVIGGGIAGVELALAMAHGLRTRTGTAEVSLIEAQPQIAADTPALRQRLLRALTEAGISLYLSARVEALSDHAVVLESGTQVPTAFTAGAAGARAHPWLAQSGLPVTGDGFVKVGPDLSVEGHNTLFAAGDCAHLQHAPRPKAGVFAVRAAPVLAHNLRAVLSGGTPRRFAPQRTYLKLISLGRKAALADKGGLTLGLPGLWRWKDRIDRRFMAQLKDLPAMPAPTPPKPQALGQDPALPMLCAGCGSKVAPGALQDALARLPRTNRPDILTGPGDDAAILRVGGVTQVQTTDHLRAFSEDPGVMARITALHALGDIWAMGAAPSTALLSLTLPRMTAELQSRTLAEVMAILRDTLTAEGAEIVGGHSTLGAELTLGLTLTGTLNGPALTTSGAQAGEVLLLTRPIGSGTLLAAEMQGRANGRDIARLLSVLQTPQGDAARLLRDAHALTDVTGFGLAGHLRALCEASSLRAEIDLSAIPVFPGALALAEAGLTSSLWVENRAAAPVEGPENPTMTLLHDPQTAGGFLAAVSADQVTALLDQLHQAGHEAAAIGRLDTGTPRLTAG